MCSTTQRNVLGAIGDWAAGCIGNSGRPNGTAAPTFSFRQEGFVAGAQGFFEWRRMARSKLKSALLLPDLEPIRRDACATVKSAHLCEVDGVRIEELSWQLPYGSATRALLLQPAHGLSSPAPAVLALHCHGGKKIFGFEKITATDQPAHPVMAEHQTLYYGGREWANELAKRGYVVLVHDVFPFGSRRVLQSDVLTDIASSCAPSEFQAEANAAAKRRRTDAAAAGKSPENVIAQEYNYWASEHEHVIAKSLFNAGLSWPGLLLAEDIAALDILCSRPKVDASRIGCGGLSGGGLRTMLLGAADDRISCAVQVGYFTTCADMVLQKSFVHSWQGHIPSLARVLDIPDIVAMRCPLPTMVQHDKGDELFTSNLAEAGLTSVAASFEKAGYKDLFDSRLYDGPHKFDLNMQADAFEFFDRWLLQPSDQLANLRQTILEQSGRSVEYEIHRLEAEKVELEKRIAELQKQRTLSSVMVTG